jgi:hypothetical protein
MLDSVRPRLLLCWGYHRAGWIRPFEKLRDQFDVHYLFHRSRDEEEGSLTDAPRYYWLDFKDAASVIERIRPDRIVFMALDGAWVIALNAEARRRGVPTFIVQHGHLNPAGEGGGSRGARAVSQPMQGGSPLAAVRFAGRSFGLPGGLRLARTLRFMTDARRTTSHDAMRRHVFLDRLPDHYVAMSPESAQVHLQLDGAPLNRVACIGVPEYDDIFCSVPLAIPRAGPVLLLDSPNAENRWNATTTTVREKVAFLKSLDSAVARTGRRLRIKLHPETYRADWVPDLPHGTYLRDADLVEEFTRAAICVGFDSTLMVPAVWLRPTVLVRLRPSQIIDVAAQSGAACIVHSLDAIDEEVLASSPGRFAGTGHGRQAYVRRLAYRPDGCANERLREVLSEPETAMLHYSLASQDGQDEDRQDQDRQDSPSPGGVL